MGVVNMTPDSFSDGGTYNNLESALQHCQQLVAAGATILDIGGESTRPGAERIGVVQEIERVIPLIQALKKADWLAVSKVEISCDTMNSQTASDAVAAGADYVNDVSGGKADPGMFTAVAQSKAKFILSHWRGFSDHMDHLNHYDDVVVDVTAEISQQVDAAVEAGIERSRIIIDPGLGFAKIADQNWQVLAGLDLLKGLGLPILVGASRKRFLAATLDPEHPNSVSIERRDLATAVLSATLAHAGIWGLRVHNVAASRDAIALATALQVAGN
jgi:dihydropteroate synthase